MPLPLSLDLRERIVTAYEDGLGSYEEIADLFGVGRASVSRLLSRHRHRGALTPNPHGGGNPARIGPADGDAVAALVHDLPDATLDELADGWRRRTGREISRSSMLRALQRFGITLKKSRSKLSRHSDPTSRRNAPRSRP